MKLFKWALAVVSALSLVACGGGGGSAGCSPLVTCATPGPIASTVEVVANALQVGNGGDEVTITAVVKGQGNVSMANVPVAFSTDTGTLTGASSTTDAAGIATAKLSAGANKTNRTMTVTVTSGGAGAGVCLAWTQAPSNTGIDNNAIRYSC